MHLFFLEKRSTYFVWLPSDLESALKIDLEAVKKTLYIPKQGGPFSQPEYYVDSARLNKVLGPTSELCIFVAPAGEFNLMVLEGSLVIYASPC